MGNISKLDGKQIGGEGSTEAGPHGDSSAGPEDEPPYLTHFKNKKTHPLLAIFLFVGTALWLFMGVSRILNGFVLSGILSILFSVIFVIVGYIAWEIGDMLRLWAKPDSIFVVGGIADIAKTKLFWMVGPQSVAVFVAFGLTLIGSFKCDEFFDSLFSASRTHTLDSTAKDSSAQTALGSTTASAATTASAVPAVASTQSGDSAAVAVTASATATALPAADEQRQAQQSPPDENPSPAGATDASAEPNLGSSSPRLPTSWNLLIRIPKVSLSVGPSIPLRNGNKLMWQKIDTSVGQNFNGANVHSYAMLAQFDCLNLRYLPLKFVALSQDNSQDTQAELTPPRGTAVDWISPPTNSGPHEAVIAACQN